MTSFNMYYIVGSFLGKFNSKRIIASGLLGWEPGIVAPRLSMIWYLVYAECYITSRLEYCCCCSHPPVLIPMSKMVHWERTLPPGTQRYRPVGTIEALTPPVRAMLQLDGMMSLWRVTGSKRPLQRRVPHKSCLPRRSPSFPPNLSHFRPTPSRSSHSLPPSFSLFLLAISFPTFLFKPAMLAFHHPLSADPHLITL